MKIGYLMTLSSNPAAGNSSNDSAWAKAKRNAAAADATNAPGPRQSAKVIELKPADKSPSKAAIAQEVIKREGKALIASGLTADAAEAKILWALEAGHSQIKAVLGGEAPATGKLADFLAGLPFIDILPEPPAGGEAEIAFTYGTSETDMDLPSAVRMTWAELCRVMTRHEAGAKKGRCIIPGLFTGSKRLQDETAEIHALVLDYDHGADLDALVSAVEAKGWTAAIASTHSHLTTETAVRKTHWQKYVKKNPDLDLNAAAAAYLAKEKKYLAAIYEGAKFDREGEEYVFLRHAPCPKFRVALRLSRPWRAADYPSQSNAIAAWREAYKAVANSLGAPFDESGGDPNRLFYLPRHPKDVPPVSRVLHGEACDAFAMVSTSAAVEIATPAAKALRPRAKKVEYLDASTGEVFDLSAWLKGFGRRFLIVDALRARRSDVFTNKVSENRHHILCPYEAEHTNPGMDGATFITNAGEGKSEGFVIHCRHGHCHERDRADYVCQMLEDGWLEIEDLTNPAYLLPEPDLIEAAIDQLNAREAVVVIGGKTRILIEPPEGDGRSEPEFAQVQDRRNWHAPKRVMVEGKMVQAFELWLNSPNRREYKGVVFEPQGAHPDYYNYWQGFAVEPNPNASCARFLDHLRHNICRGEEGLFKWFVAWLAQMVQQPSEKPGVAVVLRGGRGTGKTIVGEYVGAMLHRRNYVQITQPKQLVGNFNAHLKQALLIQVEEAFYAGNPAIEGPLKNLVTSDVRMVEPKGVDAFPVRDCARLLITSNEALVVPAGNDERRWAVFDVGSDKKQDHAYFGAIAKELANGGAGALLSYLQAFDLSGIDVRAAPETTALLDQKLNSLQSMPKWLHDCLTEGTLDTSGEWPERVEKKRLYESYRSAVARDRFAREIGQEQFGKLLREIIPACDSIRPRGEGPRSRFYVLPSLEACRASFSNWIGQNVHWDG